MHKCFIFKNGKHQFPECVCCGGRIHDVSCTSRRDPEKDCCLERHVNVYVGALLPPDRYYLTPEGRNAIFSGFDNQTYDHAQILSELSLT